MSGTPHSTLYYEYLVMPLGLTNAPVLSFRIWLMMLSGIFLDRSIFVYLDDILMFFSIDLDGPCPCFNSISIQFNFLYIALQWLLENKLCVKAQNWIPFIIHVISGLHTCRGQGEDRSSKNKGSHWVVSPHLSETPTMLSWFCKPLPSFHSELLPSSCFLDLSHVHKVSFC